MQDFPENEFELVDEVRELRRQAEMTRRQLFTTLESISDLVVAFDRNFRYVYVNAQAAVLLGKSPAELIGKELLEVSPDFDDAFFARLRQAMDENRTVYFEHFHSQTNVWLEVSAYPSDDGATVYCRDISKRKRAENALSESEARYRIVAETASDALISIDETSRILFANQAATRIFGYSIEELIGADLAILMPQKQRNAHKLGLQRYLTDGVRKLDWNAVEVPAQRKNGDLFPLEISFGEYNKDGKRYFIGLARDISERKRAELEREILLQKEQEARLQAEDANRLKDEFLATVSHELRTPLNAIIGWTSIARQHLNDPEMLERALEIVERNGRTQNQIISDILEVSRIITGKLNLKIESVDLKTILEGALETLRPAAEAKKIRLELSLKNKTFIMRGDGNRLQQIFWNLLSNAVKFTPANGKIAVVMKHRKNIAEISINDSGEGIAAEFLPYVFDRFRQAEGAENRRHGGLGLGLAIVRHLTELHGGTVAAASAGKGLGATFTISLPLVEKVKSTAKKTSDKLLAESSKPLHNKYILVVDDESEAGELVKLILEKQGARVSVADSAAVGVERLNKEKFDLLISDIGMPESDGYAMMRGIRNSQTPSAIPALALTAYARPEDVSRARAAGFQAHLAKPVNSVELIETIENLLNK